MRLLLLLFIAMNAGAVEIAWQHSGDNTTYFEIWGNTKDDAISSKLGVVDSTVRSFNIELPQNCSKISLLVKACNEQICSDPSAIRSYSECNAPASPFLE